MKRLAVWLSVMMCFFGSCQLYAAPSAGGLVFLYRYAREHSWPRWVFLLIGVAWICLWFSDKKKKE